MAIETIKVPDIGGADNVEVIEISVAVGDVINTEDPMIVLETDKASMDIPAPKGGTVRELLVKVGDKLSEGSDILQLETGDGESQEAGEAEPAADASAESSTNEAKEGGSQKTAAELPVTVPDIGGAENVDVIEVCVKVGDEIEEGDSIIVLESDKASMEIPSPAAGKVVSISIKEGDKVSEGIPVLVLATESAGQADTAAKPAGKKEGGQPASATQSAAKSGGVQSVTVPDIGGAEDVDVIEVCVAEGDEVEEGDSLVVLESDKASMEVPSPVTGKVKSLAIREGDKVSMGVMIGQFEVQGAAEDDGAAEQPAEKPSAAAGSEDRKPAPDAGQSQTSTKPQSRTGQPPASPGGAGADVYAGPAVRKLARQLGVDLREIQGSGPRGRLVKDDVRNFVKNVMSSRNAGAAGVGSGAGIPAMPTIDFAQFGEVEMLKMSKIKKLTAANMSRNWLNVPHVTQFDDVDITEMEAFRQSMKADAEKAGVKLTPVPFLLKACAAALKAEPSFNVSLHTDGEHIVQKKYVHIGMAVDTPAGLMVPVIRDVDQKGLFELASEVIDMAKKARDGKLQAKDMQGGCFTISSLGAIGGRGFTPIVNAPEVAILAVSRSETRPVWDGKNFVPRLMLPLSLSYDHRAINGSDAGRFFTYLNTVISDIRRLLL